MPIAIGNLNDDDGNYYIASHALRFSVINPYAEGQLAYTIECLSEPKLKVKNLPKLFLQPGMNRFDLDLGDNRSFKAGKEYLLKVFLPNSRELKLRFLYKSE